MNIVQIGSNKGYDELTHMVKSNDFLLLIEPFEMHNDSLKECYNFVNNLHIENIVIVDNEEIENVDFYFHNDDHMEQSSLSKEHLYKHFSDNINVINKKCKTINKLFDSYNLKDIDILFIDAEGFDDKIIKSIDFEKYNIKRIFYENTHIDNSIENILIDKNFIVFKNILINGWMNLAYKENDNIDDINELNKKLWFNIDLKSDNKITLKTTNCFKNIELKVIVNNVVIYYNKLEKIEPWIEYWFLPNDKSYLNNNFIVELIQDNNLLFKEEIRKDSLQFDNLVNKYNLNIRGVISIGAHFGEENEMFDKYNIKNKLFFEPVPHTFEILKQNIKDGILVNKALGNENRKITMNIERINNGQSSSILKSVKHSIQYPWITFDEQIEVDMIRLDDYPKSNLYNFIMIDVQGYELEVLKGAEKTLENIDYIISEINRDEVYENCAKIEQLDEYLSKFGFERLETDWGGDTWGDAFYMKKPKKLIFDIGSNIGKFTNVCEKNYNCKVVLVEANKDLYDELNLKFGKKHHVLNLAIDNECDKEKDFYVAKWNEISTLSNDWVSNSRFSNNYGLDKIVKVKTITIDKLIEMYGKPDLIKLDVEGYEYNAILGLSQKVDKICFEFAEEEKENIIKSCKYLSQLGYNKFGYIEGDEYLKEPDVYENIENFKLFDILNKDRKEMWGMIWVKSERKISLAITSYNRDEYTISSFKNVLDDDRISEIVICDDYSDLNIFESLKSKINSLNFKKIKLHRNEQNLGSSLNKKQVVSLCENDWVIIFDSDNIIPKSYIDKIFEINEWNSNLMYLPDKASIFDYRMFDNQTFDKYDVTEKLSDRTMLCLLNTGNYFVNKNKYLETYKYDITVKHTDGIYFIFLWLKNDYSIYVVKDMEYIHNFHDKNGWTENVIENEKKLEQLVSEFKQEILNKFDTVKISDNSEDSEYWVDSYPKISEIINQKNYKIGAEIGVALAGHSNYILGHTNIDKLYGIDPYLCYDKYDTNEYYLQNNNQNKYDKLYKFIKIRLSKYGDRYEHIRDFSDNAVLKFNEESLDFLYIDGNHGEEFVRNDLRLWWPIIKKGGIMSGHDYQHPGLPYVTKEVDSFAKSINKEVIYLGDHVSYINKDEQNIKTYIQIGSNKGNDSFQRIIQSIDEKIKIFLIEPNSDLLTELSNNYKSLNDKHDIKIINYGISTKNEKNYIHLYDDSGLSSLINRKSCPPNYTKEIDCLSFNDFCNQYNIKNIELLYINTEGLDYEILNSIDLTNIEIENIIFEKWPFDNDDNNNKYRTGPNFLNTHLIPKYNNYKWDNLIVDGMESFKLTKMINGVFYKCLGDDTHGMFGNQLFEIATTIGLAIENNVDAVFPPWKYNGYFKHGIKTDNPEKFNIKSEYQDPEFKYNKIPYTNGMNLNGYFQSEKYFKHCEKEIRETFTLKEEYENNIREKWNDILKTNTVSIHVRRGDYLKNQSFHPCPPLKYFEKSIEYVENISKIDSILIFSDDIQWCKENFIGNRYIFVENQNEIDDMFLMSFCKHNIITNSSFSWWGSWLNKNENKIVCAPHQWFGNGWNMNWIDIYYDKIKIINYDE